MSEASPGNQNPSVRPEIKAARYQFLVCWFIIFAPNLAMYLIGDWIIGLDHYNSTIWLLLLPAFMVFMGTQITYFIPVVRASQVLDISRNRLAAYCAAPVVWAVGWRVTMLATGSQLLLPVLFGAGMIPLTAMLIEFHRAQGLNNQGKVVAAESSAGEAFVGDQALSSARWSWSSVTGALLILVVTGMTLSAALLVVGYAMAETAIH